MQATVKQVVQEGGGAAWPFNRRVVKVELEIIDPTDRDILALHSGQVEITPVPLHPDFVSPRVDPRWPSLAGGF